MTHSGEYEVAVQIEVKRFEDALCDWHDVLIVRYGSRDTWHQMDAQFARERIARCKSLEAALTLAKALQDV